MLSAAEFQLLYLIFAQFLFVVDLNQHLDQLAQDVDRGNLAL